MLIVILVYISTDNSAAQADGAEILSVLPSSGVRIKMKEIT